jgi:hypothetical protein
MSDRRQLRIVQDVSHDDTSEKALDKASELIANQAKVGMQLSTSLAKTRICAFAALALAIFVAVWPQTGNDDNSGRSSPVSEQPEILSHWLSISSGVRHNSSCRWYGKSDGRKCRADEGTPCRKCGG